MKNKQNQTRAYAVSIAIAFAVMLLSALVNRGRMNTLSLYAQPMLAPPSWVFPVVWSGLFLLMGISAAKVWLSCSPERSDALFLYGVQLVVNFLWTVFFFRFGDLLLSLLWLIFLIALVALMILRFERCAEKAGKLQFPYLIWLCFALYLNLELFLRNR